MKCDRQEGRDLLRALELAPHQRIATFSLPAMNQRSRVWRVLEDPSSEASARVGAAVLLATAADDSERARLRVAANGIAAPAVRVAIGAVVSGEEDEGIIEALDAVHGAEPANRTLRRAGERGTG